MTAPGELVPGGLPVEFRTAGDLAALLNRLPADTPLDVAYCLRQDPALDGPGLEERLAFAVEQDAPEDGEPAEVTIGAFYAVRGRALPAATVAVNPYDRALEAIRAADDDVLFAAMREMLSFVAGNLDGDEDAGLFEAIAGDPRLAERTRLEAQLLREAAERLTGLQARIAEHLAATDDGPAQPAVA